MGVVTDPREFSDIEHLYCGSVFPNPQVFEGCETALCFFTAAYFGMQDVYWVAKAGLVGTCVDLDGERLERMRELYPEGWQFIEEDAYHFAADALEQGSQWDVLTLDPWSGQFDQCAELIDTWTTLARKVVILGHGNYRLTPPAPPEGWKLTQKIRRSDFKGGVSWMVFEHER